MINHDTPNDETSQPQAQGSGKERGGNNHKRYTGSAGKGRGPRRRPGRPRKLAVKQIVSEAIAAAVGYGLAKPGTTAMVADIGSSTSDVSTTMWRNGS